MVPRYCFIRSGRNQSSWVLLHVGIAYSRFSESSVVCQSALASGPPSVVSLILGRAGRAPVRSSPHQRTQRSRRRPDPSGRPCCRCWPAGARAVAGRRRPWADMHLDRAFTGRILGARGTGRVGDRRTVGAGIDADAGVCPIRIAVIGRPTATATAMPSALRRTHFRGALSFGTPAWNPVGTPVCLIVTCPLTPLFGFNLTEHDASYRTIGSSVPASRAEMAREHARIGVDRCGIVRLSAAPACLVPSRRCADAQHVVAARHQLHGRGEIALPARGRIRDRRGDNTGRRCRRGRNNRHQRVVDDERHQQTEEQAQPRPDTMPPPMTLPHVSRPITFSTCIRSTRQWSHPGPRTPDPTGSRRRAEPLRTYRRNRSATLRRRVSAAPGLGG